MSTDEPGFLHRTARALTRTGDAAVRRLLPGRSPQLPEREQRRLETEIRACVAPTTSEMTARGHANVIGAHYHQLDQMGRERFFELLGASFGIDRPALNNAIAERQRVLAKSVVDDGEILVAERGIRTALASPRELLFTRLNSIDDEGVKFVVDLRADLRAFKSSNPEFKAMDNELKDLLGSWFDVGHLELRKITWETSAALLERLISYESVHAIESWSDLKNRLDSDRRCYAFFHPGMPDEPLIFVEVALVEGLAGDLGVLLELDAPPLDPAKADTAIFYSISNCQNGLAGVNLGDLLIKQVVADLLKDLPHLKVFSTLSPVPGFRSWLEERLADDGNATFRHDELLALRTAMDTQDVANELPALLARHTWPQDQTLANALRTPLLRLCASFVVETKRGLKAMDQVANFHLSNGARVERLNWLANTAPAGLDRAAGIMANYRYVPDDIEQAHDEYISTGEIAMSNDVSRLLQP